MDNKSYFNQKYVEVHGYIDRTFDICFMTQDVPDQMSEEAYKNYVVWYRDETCKNKNPNFEPGYGMVYGVFNLNDKYDFNHIFKYSIAIERIERP